MEVKAVLFDLDDTLYGSFGECDQYACTQVAAYAEKNLGISGEEFAKTFFKHRKKFARQLPGMPPIHDRVLCAQRALEEWGICPFIHARKIHQVYWDGVFEKMEIRQGVISLLTALKQKQIKVAICTDMLADIQMEKLERLGLVDLVDFMVSSEEAGMDKPGAAIFLLALQKCNCLAGEAIMVGDNFRHDIEGAMDCGIEGIWLNWNNLSSPESSENFKEAKSFLEVEKIIKEMI